ncbi:MAG TPA: hypothetical protein PLD88_12430, partial [Candidatus Berkiella sp.]|nr:hypothetical protein [Candidatus Berkiella sp.]
SFNTEPVKKLLTVIEEAKKKWSRVSIIDHDEFIITVLLNVLSDPTHPAGKTLCKQLFQKWIDRGGKIPIHWKKLVLKEAPPPKKKEPIFKPTKIDRIKHDAIGFSFALRYIIDCGVSLDDLSRAFLMDDNEINYYLNLEYKMENQIDTG